MGGPVRGTSDRETRRNSVRRRRDRNRRLAIVGAVAAVAVIGLAVVRPGLSDHHRATPSTPVASAGVTAATTTATEATSATTAAAPPATAAAAPTTTTAGAPPKTTAKTTTAPAATKATVPTLADLPIDQDPIPYGPGRRAEMAAYSERHYGVASAKLDPKLIVLHYTAGDSYQSAWSTFASDAPAAGPAGTAAESPGTCSHFIVDQQGTIHQLVSLQWQCRHTIGLNRWAIGIEMVQSDAGHDSAWATDQILNRPKQIGAVLALVRALMARYGLGKTDVIGHGTANGDAHFVDLEGWRNDHTDWLAPAVRALRKRL